MSGRMVQITTMYPKELMAQIDTVRGELSRSEWFRRAAEEVAYKPKFAVTVDPGAVRAEAALRLAFPVRTEDEVAAWYGWDPAIDKAWPAATSWSYSDGAKGT